MSYGSITAGPMPMVVRSSTLLAERCHCRPYPFPALSPTKTRGYALTSARLGTNGSIQAGANVRNLQRQVNLVDNVSVQKGSHNLKFGVDYRRLSPQYAPFLYAQLPTFLDVPSAEAGNPFSVGLQSLVGATFLFHNLGAFAQDTWHVVPRLTFTYGLRWDVDVAPSSTSGPEISAVTGFSLTDLSNLALAPAGRAPFKTTYGNVAPRVGAAYQISQNPEWSTVVRGGFGIFYDLATSEVNNLFLGSFPFSAPLSRILGGTFPLDPAAAPPPPSNRRMRPMVEFWQRLIRIWNCLIRFSGILRWNKA